MAVASKWIEGLEPQDPITMVARRALRERLKIVWRYARRVARRSKTQVEDVHQLRVATRRAQASLDLFSDLLPRNKSRRMKRQLRRLRRAAGPARDLDVLSARLKQNVCEKPNPSTRIALQRIRQLRRRVQKPLVQEVRRAKKKGFQRRSRKLVQSVTWRQKTPEPAFDDAAREQLITLADIFFAAADSDLSDIDAMHRMRIVGKKLRYGMETLVCAFDTSFRTELYPSLEAIQEEVGDVNDHATAIEIVEALIHDTECQRVKDSLACLLKDEQDQLASAFDAFRSGWTPAHVIRLRRQFDLALGRAAHPSAANPRFV